MMLIDPERFPTPLIRVRPAVVQRAKEIVDGYAITARPVEGEFVGQCREAPCVSALANTEADCLEKMRASLLDGTMRLIDMGLEPARGNNYDDADATKSSSVFNL